MKQKIVDKKVENKIDGAEITGLQVFLKVQ
jgi:hypothetical protein